MSREKFVDVVHYLTDRELAGNTLLRWVGAIVTVAVVLLVLRWLRGFIARRIHWFARRTESDWDDLFGEILGSARGWFLLVSALWIGSMTLQLPAGWSDNLDRLLVVVVFVQGAMAVTRLAGHFIKKRFAQHEDAETRSVATMLGIAVRFVTWSIALLLILGNLGIDVSALVAGLGVGGIAIALATQNLLGDMFASVSILLDKPFVVGDFLIVDDFLGTVERIGIKSTRLNSLHGERIVMSNADLLKSRIRNYAHMPQRRVVFNFRISYDTPVEVVEKIPGAIREIIEARSEARFDRAHFASFGEYALMFEACYYCIPPDYNVYMDAQQAINLAICRRLAELGARFAYPTQIVHVASQPSA